MIEGPVARTIAVYRLEDFEAPPPDSWRVHPDAEGLFQAPLGSESDVRRFWAEPADLLNLPLLSSIYERGFFEGICWGGADLPQLLDELQRLEEFWPSLNLALADAHDLAERADSMRRAVQVAVDHRGHLVIT